MHTYQTSSAHEVRIGIELPNSLEIVRCQGWKNAESSAMIAQCSVLSNLQNRQVGGGGGGGPCGEDLILEVNNELDHAGIVSANMKCRNCFEK